nr:MAG TPA: hypothetical protein [Caudoviricetes sp.]
MNLLPSPPPHLPMPEAAAMLYRPDLFHPE